MKRSPRLQDFSNRLRFPCSCHRHDRCWLRDRSYLDDRLGCLWSSGGNDWQFSKIHRPCDLSAMHSPDHRRQRAISGIFSLRRLINAPFACWRGNFARACWPNSLLAPSNTAAGGRLPGHRVHCASLHRAQHRRGQRPTHQQGLATSTCPFLIFIL